MEQFKDRQVKDIHDNVLLAQQKSYIGLKKMLGSLEIPTESDLERKTKKLLSLGITKASGVEKGEELLKIQKNKKEKIKNYQRRLDFFDLLKKTYITSNFILLEDFEKVCDKYNLVIAGVSNYIKDIPEKNLDEILNISKIKKEHIRTPKNLVFCNSFTPDISQEFKNKFKRGFDITEMWEKYQKEMLDTMSMQSLVHRLSPSSTPFCTVQVGHDHDSFRLMYDRGSIPEKIIGYDCLNIRQKYDKFYVAAPISHFDSETPELQTSFFTAIPPEDPIVIEYCKHDIVRIITKWGTSDDQSYLAPELTDAKLN